MLNSVRLSRLGYVLGSEILNNFALGDKASAALAVDTTGIEPACAQVIFEIFPNFGTASDVWDFAARTMGVSASSAEAVERRLQQFRSMLA